MRTTGILELSHSIKESTVSSKMKMVIKADHESYLKRRIIKKDIKK